MADFDQDDIDDSEDETPELSDSEASPAPLNPMVSAYLQNKQAMESARQRANVNQLYAGIGRAAGTLAHSAYGSNAPEDTKAYDALDKSAQAPVQQEAARQAVQGKDPNSASAIQLRKIYTPILQKAGIDPTALDNLGADDIKSYVQHPLEFQDKQKTLETTKQLALKASAEAREDKADTKLDADQSKAYTTMRKDLESFRGNQSVQQAATAVQNSDKALALVQATPTPQNLALLADEMGKIAMGGVPGEHGVQALMPSNLYTKIAEMKSWITGHPNASAADVSEYIKNNKDYINQVRTISSKALKSYRQNIAKGYKDRVDPDNYQEAVDDYSLDGSTEGPEPASAAPAPSQGGPPPQLVQRKMKDGRIALFDANKKFVRWQ